MVGPAGVVRVGRSAAYFAILLYGIKRLTHNLTLFQPVIDNEGVNSYARRRRERERERERRKSESQREKEKESGEREKSQKEKEKEKE